jgi:hypothetical protein
MGIGTICEFRFPVEHNNIPINSLTFHCADRVYCSYNVATCFGSYSHHRAIHYKPYINELNELNERSVNIA